MAIQIDEKKLSPEAQKALANAKSKSQLLRDALEFYVNSRAYTTGETEEVAPGNTDIGIFKFDVLNGLDEIKSLILNLPQLQVAVGADLHIEDKPKNAKHIEKHSEKQNGESNLNKQVVGESSKETADVKSDSPGLGMTEEERRAYEASFDNILNL